MKCRILPPLSILLILVQAGLTVGHCHEVGCDSPNQGAKHIHLDHLLDWGSAPTEDDHDGPEHDSWTVSDVGPMTLPASTGLDEESSSLLFHSEVCLELTANRFTVRPPHPPPRVAPSCPRYLTLRTLRI